MKTDHIVLTTIFVPNVLKELHENLERHGHLDRTKVWVVGDTKTPDACRQVCEEVTRAGLEVRYLDIAEQDAWGKEFPQFYARIPYGNESRRNIGYLFALQDGCERLIAIDDDNFPTQDDFIGGHSLTGRAHAGATVAEESGYHNVCEYLTIEPRRPLYPRGFPFALRGRPNAPLAQDAPPGSRIGVTAGLWLREPDIDATSWLNGKVESTGYTGPDHFVLSQRTWSPVNTQNTSVVRDLVPGFLCVPMGRPVPGGRIERYGDIWGGYFLQAVLQDTPYHVAFGRPLVDHRRNPHNYLDDLRHEFWGMVLTDWMLQELRSKFQSAHTTPLARAKDLAAFIATTPGSLPAWCPPEMRTFLLETAETLSLWCGVCEELL